MPRSHVLVPLTLALAGCFNVDELTQPLVDANTEILERQAANEQDIATLYMMVAETQATIEPLGEALVQIEQTRADLEQLQLQLDDLALRAASAEDVAALQVTADTLQADLDSASTRLTTLEDADVATVAWVTDQGFASATATADLDTRLSATEASQLTLATDMTGLLATATDLDSRLTSQEAVAVQALADFDALSVTVDGVQEDLAAGSDELANAQEDLSGLQTSLEALQTTADATSDAVASQQTTLDDLLLTTSDLQASADDHAALIATHTSDLAAMQVTVDGHTVLIDAATADIASVRYSTEQNLDAIVLLESDVSTLTSTVDDLSVRMGTVEGDTSLTADALDGLATDLQGVSTDVDDLTAQTELLEDDLGALESDVSALQADMPGFELALYETTTDGGERTVAGRQGLQLKTADGAFYLSGWMTGTDFTSDTIHRVTMYVANPTSSDITVDLEGCSGDATDLFVDGALHTAADDHDGDCDATWTVTFTPGSHTLSLRSQDVDAHNEGFGIGAGWVTASGLTFDREAFEAAGQDDPVR